MEVILLERIKRLGQLGDTVKVRNGFARNYLIPMKKALRATDDNKKLFEERRHIIEEQNAKLRSAAEAQVKVLDGLSLTLVRQASQEGKLYGSVTVRDVAEVIKEAGHGIPKSQIILTTAIKNIGNFPVRVNLYADVVANLTITIARLETEAA